MRQMKIVLVAVCIGLLVSACSSSLEDSSEREPDYQVISFPDETKAPEYALLETGDDSLIAAEEAINYIK